MAWWAWLLLGWAVLATLLALCLGKVAGHIKRQERLDAECRSLDEQLRHHRTG
jgi:hypothetical protein